MFEETLGTVVRLGAPGDGASRHGAAWQARRNYAYVAGALAASGMVAPAVADALVQELEDALVLRGRAEVAGFAGRPFPVDAATAPRAVAAGRPEVWLEAEIERHLELLSAMSAAERQAAGGQTL
ncbi:MAG: hypothetical protein KY439_10065, partial [Actinobacteria bacterium]|nr:hypothetical protein [Actinomycetota bacterium]